MDDAIDKEILDHGTFAILMGFQTPNSELKALMEACRIVEGAAGKTKFHPHPQESEEVAAIVIAGDMPAALFDAEVLGNASSRIKQELAERWGNLDLERRCLASGDFTYIDCVNPDYLAELERLADRIKVFLRDEPQTGVAEEKRCGIQLLKEVPGPSKYLVERLQQHRVPARRDPAAKSVVATPDPRVDEIETEMEELESASTASSAASDLETKPEDWTLHTMQKRPSTRIVRYFKLTGRSNS